MQQYPQFRKYINCFLFENIEEVTKKFMGLLKDYRICEFSELVSKKKNPFANHQEQLLAFFNGIIQEDPLRQPQEIIDHWRNSELHSDCNFHPILPEDIIAYYTVLNETLLHFIPTYDSDQEKSFVLQEELNALESAIQKIIAQSFLQWQDELHGQKGQ